MWAMVGKWLEYHNESSKIVNLLVIVGAAVSGPGPCTNSSQSYAPDSAHERTRAPKNCSLGRPSTNQDW